MQETRRRILSAIADGPVSGPDLATALSLSRAAVWKHVETLREAGFEIESGPEGYELETVPEYGGPAVEFGLEAPYSVEYHEQIPSTNDRARDLAAEGATNMVVLADEQTGGRGRLNRTWSSPSGGIWLSFLFRPEIPPARVSLLTLAAGVATAETINDFGVQGSIKWPNDVLVGGQKIAGILTEMEGEADKVTWVVIGVGLNANIDPDRLPDEQATSLQAERGTPVDRRSVTQGLIESVDRLRADPDKILPAWREQTSTLGREVRVSTPNTTHRGMATDVTETGALVIQTEDGQVEVTAGDCEHLRPTGD